MKNKKLLYVLVPGVLIVWGMIIYRIFSVIHEDKEEIRSYIENIPLQSGELLNDTFSINSNYRDPFYRKVISRKSEKNSDEIIRAPVKTKQVPTNNKPQTNWPSIVYGGLIKNQKSKKELVLILINGQGYSMKVGDSNSQVELTKVSKDSIEVKYGSEKKFIRK